MPRARHGGSRRPSPSKPFWCVPVLDRRAGGGKAASMRRLLLDSFEERLSGRRAPAASSVPRQRHCNSPRRLALLPSAATSGPDSFQVSEKVDRDIVPCRPPRCPRTRSSPSLLGVGVWPSDAACSGSFTHSCPRGRRCEACIHMAERYRALCAWQGRTLPHAALEFGACSRTRSESHVAAPREASRLDHVAPEVATTSSVHVPRLQLGDALVDDATPTSAISPLPSAIPRRPRPPELSGSASQLLDSETSRGAASWVEDASDGGVCMTTDHAGAHVFD
mmetsp:Transcript_83858/g.233989  ORF Transcript_83858/g.233989 Transcript_83858/m.233989 type:complete len:279 (+) Transcript_83858:169-1005(+)